MWRKRSHLAGRKANGRKSSMCLIFVAEPRHLQEEKRNLAGRVGYLHAQNQSLSERVKLLRVGEVEEEEPHKP